jgi:hypothetical protein
MWANVKMIKEKNIFYFLKKSKKKKRKTFSGFIFKCRGSYTLQSSRFYHSKQADSATNKKYQRYNRECDRKNLYKRKR